MADSKETAVLVQDRTRQNAIVGTIDEQIRAFDQIAANLSQLGINGWKTVAQCKAACWLAHGAGMHPAIFIQNHYVMEGKNGALIVEPKWEFIVGVLQSRVPNFKFEVLEETDDHAKVRMSDGKTEHTVEYTLEDARRQGLLGRGGNMWTAGNTREGCLKQATKRCGRRLSSAALMDLPVGLEMVEVAAEEAGSTPQEKIQEAVKAAGNKAVAAEDVPFTEVSGETAEQREMREDFESSDTRTPPPSEPASPTSEDATTIRQRLAAAIKRDYGLTAKADVAEKVNFVYNAMVEEATGVNPKTAFKPGQVGPAEAKQIIAYLEKKREARKSGKAADPTPSEDAPPPTEEEEEAPTVRTKEQAYEALMATVDRARKSIKPARKFIQEAPPNSGVFWFTDGPTLSDAGEKVSVAIQKAGEVVLPIEKIDQLEMILRGMCDKAERVR